jgi:pyruvate/2-oxoglutarate dehydrogenase complex dihydrolipoamide dehydrogenase (E3) component
MAHYDLLVIGTGPAGQKAAVQAAKLGKKVGIIERKMVLGGVCINTGTIPSKSLREAVLYLSGFRQRSIYGGTYRLKKTITIEDLAFRADHVIIDMVEKLGAAVRHISAPFQPEGGAYGDGQVHSHDHPHGTVRENEHLHDHCHD